MLRRPVLALAAVLCAAALIAGCTSSTTGRGSNASSSPARASSSTAAVSTAAGSSSAAPATASSVPPVPPSRPLNGFLVADLTFVGQQGWALGTVGCVGASGRCSALAHTTDNGRTWRSIRAPAVNVLVPGFEGSGCAAPCVGFVRFATPTVGYLFGGGRDGGLLMTTDGGNDWRRQSGNADALESLDGNVVRVSDGGCDPPGCRYVASLAGIGSTSWSSTSLPGTVGITTTGAALGRTGSHVYLIVFGNPAGGAGSARSVLWTSADDGRNWTRRGEPCPQTSQEVDSWKLTTAEDGSVSVLCQVRGGTVQDFTATSTDGGARFVSGSHTAIGSADISAFAAASASVLFVSSDETYRSTDGGRHFARLSANSGSSPGPLGWLGFASATVGHGVSVDRRTLWLTTDAGQTWTPGRLR